MNRFWRGMLTGVVVGTAMGMWLAPMLDDERRGEMMAMTRGLADRAERVFRRGKHRMEEMVES